MSSEAMLAGSPRTPAECRGGKYSVAQTGKQEFAAVGCAGHIDVASIVQMNPARRRHPRS
jgi:hypothetical protein